MRKILSLFLMTFVSVMMFAAMETTVYYTAPAATIGTYSVKLNVNFKGDGDDWHQFDMTKTALTYNGDPVYSYKYTDAYDGVGVMQFQLYEGETWKSQKVAISSWTAVATYNGKMYVHATEQWVAAPAAGGESGSDDSNVLYVWNGIGSTTDAIEKGGEAEAVQTTGTNMEVGNSQKGNYCFKMNKGFTKGEYYIGIALENSVNAGDTVRIAYFRTGDKSTYVLGMDFSADKASVATTYQILSQGDPQVLASNGTPVDSIYIVPEGVANAKYIRLYRNSGSTGVYVAKFELLKKVEQGGEGGDDPVEPTPAEKDSIYFVNVAGWAAPRVHLWGGTAAGTEWPGVEMTKLADKINNYDVYKYVADKGAYAKCIFSNNGENQTADLDWTSGKYFYNDTWYALNEIPVPLPDAVPLEGNIWKVTAETPLVAGSHYINEALLTMDGVYATTLKTNARTIAGEEFTHAIQVRTDGYPTAENKAGKEKSGSTSLIITAKEDADVTFYYNRQVVGEGGTDNDNKDLIVFDQADITTKIAGVLTIDQILDGNYMNVTKKVALKKDHTYTVTASGTTLQLHGIKLEAHFPVMQIAGAWNVQDEAWLLNDMSLAEDKLTATYEVELTPGDYEFKMIKDGAWLTKANSGQAYGLHREWPGVAGVIDDATENLKVTADVAGNYTFTWTFANDSIGIAFPDTPVEPTAKFYVTGDSALIADAAPAGTAVWAPNAIKSEKDTLVLNLKAGVDYQLSLTVDGTWNTKKTYADLTLEDKSGLYDVDGENHNIGFKLNEAGVVKVIYIAGKSPIFKLEGNFYVEPAPVVPDFYIAGTMTDWADNKIAVTGTSYKLNLEAGDYMLKVIVGEEWKGYDALTTIADGLTRGSGENEDNICFTLAEAGEVNVHYDGEFFFLNGDFYVAPVEVKYYLKNNWGSEAWTWKEMTALDDGTYMLYNVVVGGEGVNRNTADSDEGASWFAWADIETFDASYESATIGALDTVVIYFDPEAVNSFNGANGMSAQILGKYVAPVVETADFYIAGTMTNWADEKIAVTGTSYKLNLEAGDYMLKVIVGEEWKGFDALTTKADGLTRGSGENEDNICFTLAEAGEVNVHYDGEFFFLNGNFYVAPVEVKYYLKNNWGSEAWTWKEMTALDDGTYMLYNVVVGGEGVNRNTADSDEGASWFAWADIETFDASYESATIGALDTVVIYFDPEAVNSFNGANGMSAQILGKYVAPVEEGCDWENIAFLGGPAENADQFKVCKPENVGVVNIQNPSWSEKTQMGIYMTFPSAVFGEISLAEESYEKQGAGILFFLSAFTAQETEFVVNCDGNDLVITVYNAKASEPVVEHTYTVAGSSEIAFGTTWDPENAANDMVKQEDGTYKWEKAELTLAAGTVLFKVCEDHAWDVAYPAENYQLAIAEAGEYTITITFNPETKAVDAVATKTGDAEVEHTYTVAGNLTDAFGTAWDPENAANDMVKQEDGTYKWEKNDLVLAAGTVLFKVCEDHAWDVAYPASDYQLAIAEAGEYTITITFNPETKAVDAVATKTGDAEVTVNYYLVGSAKGWEAKAENIFTLNAEAGEGIEEYVIETTLEVGEGLKVLSSTGTWYPDGTGNEYVVDQNHAGMTTIYFRPAGNAEWKAFGGFIYVVPTVPTGIDPVEVDPNAPALKVLRNGQIFIIKGEKTYNVMGALVR